MRNVFFSSLRNSLITLVCLAVLPALGVILHSSLENRERSINEAQAEALRVAQILAREQQLITMRAEQLLTLLAQMPQVRNHDGPGTSAILRRLRTRSSVFINIIAADDKGHVDADGSGLLAEGVLHYEAIPQHVIGVIVLTRLVQSQRKPRAASTPGGHEDPDRGSLLFRKVPVQLGLRGFGQFNH